MANALLTNLYKRIDSISSRRGTRRLMYGGALIFFIAFILLPPIIGITLKLNLIDQVLQNADLIDRVKGAVFWSFTIALLIATLDLLAGLPLAWMITRSGSRWIGVIDALADIPFVIPTVALGYSMLLFWSGEGSPLPSLGFTINPGLGLILLLHFAFSFPVIVRVMVGALLTWKESYETAARTLGAQGFTVARTVTLPILRPGLVAAFLLAFARSLSETGATVIVAGSFENGPVFINNAKAAGLEGPMVLVSFILIISSITVFALIRVLGNRLKIPINQVWPRLETRLSSKTSIQARNGFILLIFFGLVILPSIFITFPVMGALTDGTLQRAIAKEGVWASFWDSMFLSYTIGVVVTIVNIAAGLPIAILIARKKVGKFGSTLLEAAVNVPIVVPSVALGVSLGLFWRSFGFMPEFWILVLSHATITYTYFVQSMSAALEGISSEMEETARSLGSKPFNMFVRIILPLTKYSVMSGAILTFTRCVDETGAASAVSRSLKTVPVLLVSWVKKQVPATTSDIALGIAFLVLTSFISLLALRLLVYRREK
jgi:thiamine transport system permease protein